MATIDHKRPFSRRLAALGYLLLLLLILAPNLTELATHLLGNNIDNWIFFWNDWWLRQALADGRSWFFTPYLFHPQGTSLVAHSSSFLNSLAAAALTPLSGPILAYNLVLLGGLWLGAFGTFLLVDDLTQRPFPAFLAGIVFALAPYHLTQSLAHVHLGSIHWWPLYVYFLRHALQTNAPRRHALFAGLTAAATIWSGLQLGLLLGLWTAVYLLWRLWQDRRLPWQPLLLTGASAFVVSLPLLWPILVNFSTFTDTSLLVDESLTKQTDLLAYLMPPTYHTLWGDAIQPLYYRFIVNQAYMPYLGTAAGLLALLAVIGRRRHGETTFWAGSALLWLLFAAGSALRFNGTLYGQVPLPYAWFSSIFPFSTLRSPDRFNLLLVLSLAILAGLGSARLFDWLKLRQAQAATAVALLLILLDFLPAPLPSWPPLPDSAFLQQIAADSDDYAVINYPFGYTRSKLWLAYQTRHGKPIAEGHLSRYTAETYAFIHNEPLLIALYPDDDLPGALPDGWLQPDTPVTAVGPALRRLTAADFRYLLLHHDYADTDHLALLSAAFPLIPSYRDDTLSVFDLTQPRPWRFGPEPAILAPGVALLETRLRLDGATLHANLLLEATAGFAATACQLTQNDRPLTTFTLFDDSESWQIGDLLLLPLTAPVSAEGGSLALACAGQPATDLAELHPRPGGLLLRDRSGDLRFGHAINLLGVRREMQGSNLHLHLGWETAVALPTDYKLFVHLLDTGGAIVRQADTMPCSWTCPTSQWAPGQTIRDSVTLDLWDLPSGDYRLALGWYDPADGTRLSAQTVVGDPIPDGYAILPTPITVAPRPTP